MRIAVAGGNGAVGTHVVEVLHEQGHEAVVLSRHAGIDLTSDDASAATRLAEQLAGTDAVVDVLSVQTRSAKGSETFFRTTTSHLLAAEQAAGVGHHVALSIVGVGQAPYGYYAGKVTQEKLVEAGPVPWTILRATQFHEFATQIYGQITVGPLMLIPAMRSQPVAAREVAQRLVELAIGAPAGRVPDLGGPREERMVDMVRRYARTQHRRGPILQVPLPGGLGKAMRDGTLVPHGPTDHGVQTYQEWLAALG
ncbi:NAD(P)H-binding protein [Nakamurella sp. YIM 132087]|uniref:NAD(P)H-binding protein n=1 Tax=Nakamurella alba TaxID=2665158 RepID=A0A7K1FN31_9ACTN|nr:SDR family oxidoreductase [Nakamurella alba]MTD14729.1 NAD(P)H-binding protein [Nakamurella alba]